MEFTSYTEYSSQNVMAVILKSLPRESGLSRVEYEGPSIAIYTKNPKYLFERPQIVSNIVNSVHKRIVIRTDESIRSTESESILLINKTFPKDVKIVELFFDDAIGEIFLYVDKPWLLNNPFNYTSELLEQIGWKTNFKKASKNMKIINTINTILKNSVDERIRFYKKVGERIFRTKLDDVVEASLIALGGFAELGRSSFLLSTHESKIIVDCGINQFATETITKFPRFDIVGSNIDEIDAVILSHSHLGHSGFLPSLFKFGYDGPVYCTEPNIPMTYLLCENLLETNNDNLLFTKHDLEQLVNHTFPLNFGVVTDISPDIKLSLHNSGHILGSSSVHLHIGNGDHNILYSGDLKFGKSNLLDNAFWNFPRIETLIIEGTHGIKDDTYPQRHEYEQTFIDTVNSALNNDGIILIPVDELGISQELLFLINKCIFDGIIKKTKVSVDSSIVKFSSLYEIYNEYLSKDLREANPKIDLFFLEHVVTKEKEIMNDDKGIILTSSKFKEPNSLKLLKAIIKNEKNTLIFPRYYNLHTLLYDIQTGNGPIINDRKIKVNCKVVTIPGFTNHSDYNQLMAYIRRLRPKLKRILVNHGERQKVQNMASFISKFYSIHTQHPLITESVKLL